GINLDNISLKMFRNFISVMPKKDEKSISSLLNLPTLSLEEVRELTKTFCQKYFSLSDIYYASYDQLKSNMEYFGSTNSVTEFYDRVNSFLVKKNPLDLPINLVEGHSIVGKIEKPLIITPVATQGDNRQVYFSHINLGEQLTQLSSATLIHEIAHSQQEKNIGYAEDYLNKEIISIFLEKVAALEMDPTGELLRVSELTRFNDILDRYYSLSLKMGNISNENDASNLLYIKSTFYAEKLFDMYLNERKQKNKDKYFYQIQDVFDGKITVEELIRSRNITLAQTQDLGLLKRHIK
ncbi:MAG: hypothetical protein K5666_00415, partial [Bacilli bacterium]|nr:hypothetical protein [Bacilli bacterium]